MATDNTPDNETGNSDRTEAARIWTIQFRTGQTQSFTAAKNRNDTGVDGETFMNDWKQYVSTGKLPSGHPKSYSLPRPSFTGQTQVLLTCDLREVISVTEQFHFREQPRNP